MVRHHFATADEGKTVCTAEGVPLGEIVDVEQGDAFVCPADGLLDRYGSLLGSCWDAKGRFRLKPEKVQEITDRAVTIEVRAGDQTANAAPMM